MLMQTIRRGFTLMEILIVVLILGILAAIVVPQFSAATDNTRKAALSDQLQALRVQIQMYTIQHGDTPPSLASNSWDELTGRTTYRGVSYGPYVSHVPRNLLNNSSGILVVNTDPRFGDPITGSDIGFVYNATNGFIWGTNKSGNRIYNEANPSDPNN